MEAQAARGRLLLRGQRSMTSERQLQNERREVIRQDTQVRSQVAPSGATTMHERAQVELGQEYGGRFSSLRAEQHVVGAGPVYPKLPSNNSFAVGIDAIVGIEPPLGVNIDEMEPVGTPAQALASGRGVTACAPSPTITETSAPDGGALQSKFRRRI
jgi:hypothetical protein